MPDGRVQRIDDRREVVYIVRRGRTYAAPMREVETKARVPSARVWFDLVRRNGAESAANVRLRRGTRTSRRQRRFGDLTGARSAGSKTETTAHSQLGVDVTTQPFRVAKAWLQSMHESDFDAATSLYESGAVLHCDGETIRGRRSIRAELERCPLVGVDADSAEIRGFDRYVEIDCVSGDGAHETYLEIEQGRIVEQWIDTEPAVAEAVEEQASVEVVRRGDVPEQAGDYAAEKVSHVAVSAGRPLRFARVKLTKAENPGIERPAMVEAVLEFDRSMIRAHSAAPTFTEAADLASARLRSGIEHHLDRTQRHHDPSGIEALPGTWRHGNLARTETPFFDRPEEEREIVRHKSFAADELTVEEAAWDMALLDYDFFLFVELETGDDTLLERTDDGGLTIQQMDAGPDTGRALPAEVEVSSRTTPELEVSQAIDVLGQSGEKRLFFKNGSTGRGNVIYRRYDGHYGLITPPSGESHEDREHEGEDR